MSPAPPVNVCAGFVDGTRGPLHRLSVRPDGASPPTGLVLIVQPVGEELNRSRRTVAALARAFAAQGRTCTVTDHFGTGDSAGDFGDARWDVWRTDLSNELVAALGSGLPVDVVGLRAGCLLIDALPDETLHGVRSISLVAPEASTRALLRRWLMVETARRRFAGETVVKPLRKRLIEGECIECAGYEVAPELAEALDAQAPRAEGSDTLVRRRYEVSTEATPDAPTHHLAGRPFWQLEDQAAEADVVAGLVADIVGGQSAPACSSPLTSAASPTSQVSPTDTGTSFDVRPASPWPERALRLSARDVRLQGVMHVPPASTPPPVAVVIVTGGGQYRVGAHRQFVLLARHLASCGVPTLRWDLPGMGDSDGEARDFLDNGAEIDAAVDRATAELAPRVVLWGLCDGASAVAVHAAAAREPSRIAGVVLVNPWIRTEAGAARVRLRHYYVDRLKTGGLFARLVRGRIDARASLRSFAGAVRNAFGRRAVDEAERDLPTRVLDAIERCDVPVLVAVAEADATAREFQAAFDARFPHAASAPVGPKAAPLEQVVMPGDHTFSRSTDRRRLEALTAEWISRLG